MTAPLCFLDTETTGLHPGRRVWEIGMIRREPDGREFEAQFFVEVDLSNADVHGLNVGRFYERHPLGQYLSYRSAAEPWTNGTTLLSRGEAAKKVARYTHGAHVVGAVPNFDTEVLGRLLRDHGQVPAWHYHLIDVENLAVGALAARGQVPQLPWKSHDLSAALGVQSAVDDEHTAMGDARWAMRVYDAVMSVGESNADRELIADALGLLWQRGPGRRAEIESMCARTGHGIAVDA